MKPNLSILERIIATLFTKKDKKLSGRSILRRGRRIGSLLSTLVVGVALWMGTGSDLLAQTWTGLGQATSSGRSWWYVGSYTLNPDYSQADDEAAHGGTAEGYYIDGGVEIYKWINGVDSWGRSGYVNKGNGVSLDDPSGVIQQTRFVNNNDVTFAASTDAAYKTVNIDQTNTRVGTMTVGGTGWNFTGSNGLTGGTLTLQEDSGGRITPGGAILFGNVDIKGGEWRIAGSTTALGYISVADKGSLTTNNATAGMLDIRGTGRWSFGGGITGSSNMRINDIGGQRQEDGVLVFTGGTYSFAGGIDFNRGYYNQIQAFSNANFGTYTYAAATPNRNQLMLYDKLLFTGGDDNQTFGHRTVINSDAGITYNIMHDRLMTFTGVDSSAAAIADVKGGAMFMQGNTSLQHAQKTSSTLHGTLQFRANTARQGAAIYATNDLALNGWTRFDDNTAIQTGGVGGGGEGGAIYMRGEAPSTLSLYADRGDIVFTGNTTDDGLGNANSVQSNDIHLYRDITVNMRSDKASYIYMDGGFSSDTAVGNHVLNIDLEASTFVQFGANSVSQFTSYGTDGGAVNVNSGTFRINTGGEFSTLGGSGSFTVARGATLAGGGTIEANTRINLNGFVAPDSHVYTTPAGVLRNDAPVLGTNNPYGNLKFQGNVTLGNAVDQFVYKIDVNGAADRIDNAAYNVSDTIIVKAASQGTAAGDLTLAPTDNKALIDITRWSVGAGGTAKYVVFAANGALDATNETVMDHFTIVSSGGGQIGGVGNDNYRRGASLFVEKNLGVTGLATETDIVLNVSNDANVYLYWNAATNDVWSKDTALNNWLWRGGAADMQDMRDRTYADASQPMYFKDGDYLYFTDDAAVQDIMLRGTGAGGAGHLIVSGMEISGGDYTFVHADPNSGIQGKLDNAGTPFVGVVATAQLRITGDGTADSTTATFYIPTDFDRGTVLSDGATVIIRNDAALGVYDDVDNTGEDLNFNMARGVVTVQNGVNAVETIVDPTTIQNHFEVKGGAELQLRQDADGTFTISNVTTYNAAFDEIYKGGAIHLADGATFKHIPSANSVLRFETNNAVSGGAIYADKDLTVYGNTVFDRNTARTSGGAIFVGSAGTLTFDTSDGNVVFTGNTVGGNRNSVHLDRNNTLTFTGSNNVFFDDPIASGTTGGNTMETNAAFTGFAQFQGDNVLSAGDYPGGLLTWNGGTLRLAAGAEFVLGGSDHTRNMTLGADGTIAGNGTFRTYVVGAPLANQNRKQFILQGTLSPDSDTLYSKLNNPVDHLVVGELNENHKIGLLTFVGNTTLQGATLQVDLGDGLGAGVAGDSDLIVVDATPGGVDSNVTLALNGAGKNVVKASTIAGAAVTPGGDDYRIMHVINGGTFTDGTALTGQDLLDAYFERLATTVRQGGQLELLNGDTELWITGFTDGANAKIYWTGATASTVNLGNGDWDLDATKNWTDANRTDPLTFLANDYVIFDQAYLTGDAETNAYVTAPMTTIGMQIDSGNYTFTGDPAAVIEGRYGQLTEDDGAGGTVVNNYTGTLYANGGTATIGLATDFVGGTEMNGGRINIADNNALGTYVHQDYIDYVANPAAGSKTGFINVAADGTIGTVFDNSGVGAVNDYVVANRFHVEPTAPATTSTLTFDLEAGTTLTIDNIDVRGDNSDGGAIFLGAGGELASAATNAGTLILTNNKAENGGAIFATDALTLDGNWQFGTVAGLPRDGNDATFDGGAIYASDDLTINGTADFVGNFANQDGGAINAVGDVILNGLTSFEFNTALRDGGAINAENVTINADSGFGGAVFATQRNFAQVNGGAINAADSVTINAEMTFQNNQADTGSGGAINAVGDVTLDGDTTFDGNTAGTFGGAINTNADVTIGATVTNFDGNHADILGGAINADGTITITGEANFTGNTALAGGGAINNAGGMTTTLAGVTTFTQNTADAGGAINTGGDLTIGAAATFTENEATGTEGGAIKSTANVTIGGGTQFLRNEAGTFGGAIYMQGGADDLNRKVLTLNADGADIIFDGNNVGGVLNSVHLNQFVNLVVDGANDVYFNDPLSGGNNNNFTKNGAGTVFFSGNSVLNGPGIGDGGTVAINAGTMRLVGGAAFDAGDSDFTLANGAFLDGTGFITAGQGFTINGTITPGTAVGDMMDITLIGDTQFDGATLLLDLAAVGLTDTIHITGDLNFGGTVNTIEIQNYIEGTYDIIFNHSDISVTDPNWLDRFTVDLAGANQLTPRQGATLQLTGGNNEIIQLTLGDLNLALLWIGDASQDWDDVVANETWMTFDGNKTRSGFLDNDYVVFDYDLAGDPVNGIGPTATQGNVNIAGNYIVAGMEIRSGNYEFNGVGSIAGNAAASNVDFGTYTSRERLTISGGSATLNVATNFLGGTEMSGGTVVLGNAAALGVYDHQNYLDYVAGGVLPPTASKTGYVNITGDATVGITASQTVQNRFNVTAPAGAELTIDVATGQQLTIDGVDVATGFLGADRFNGGAIFLGVGNTLARTGNGTLAFTNNTALNGGAIFATDALTLTGTNLFTDNIAVEAGGAIAATGNVILNGTTDFTDNRAAAFGGAIHTTEGVTLGGTVTNFTGNHADILGGAINADGLIEINAEANFTQNTAGAGGGAINNVGGIATMLNGVTTFTENEAGEGGAINTAGDLTIGAEATFTENKALQVAANTGGGAIKSAGAVTIDAVSTFDGNEAGQLGGAIFARNATETGTVEINAATTFDTNEAKEGGAINADIVTINTAGTQFLDNVAGNAQGDGFGGAINASTVTINAATLFDGNTADHRGGAIYAGVGETTVTIGANTRFLDNKAESATPGEGRGGAIAMGGGLNGMQRQTLLLDADGGHIIFDGNTVTQNGGAIDTDGRTNIVMQGDSSIFFGAADTINAGGMTGEILISVQGSTKVIMTAQTAALANPFDNMIFGAVEVATDADSNAEFFLQTGSMFSVLGGFGVANATFTLGEDGTLSGGGTLANNFLGDGIFISGTLDPNNDTYRYDRATDAIVLDKAENIGTLTLAGNTTFDAATFRVDLGVGGVCDLVTVDGDVNVATVSTVWLKNFENGAYDVLTTTGQNLVLADYRIDDSQLGDRHTAVLELTNGDKTLTLTTSDQRNENIYWTADADRNWYGAPTTNTENWIIDEDIARPTYFLTGDTVHFTNKNYVGSQTVNVIGEAGVANMFVMRNDAGSPAANYVFNNGGNGRIVSNNGNLEITGAGTTATFNVDVDFGGNLLMTGENGAAANKASVIFADADFANAVLDNANMTVLGDLALGGNLNVNQNVAGANSADVTVAGDANIRGFAKIAGTANAAFGTLTVTGSDDNVTPNNGTGLAVDGVASFTVDGDTQINHHTVFTNFGDAQFDGDLGIGNGTVSSLIAVDGDSFTVAGDTNIRGFANFQDVTDISFGNLNITTTLDVNTIIGPSSSFVSTGTANIGTDATLKNIETIDFNVLNVGEDLLVDNSNLADSTLTVNGDLTVNGGVKLENVKAMTFGGDVAVNGKYANGFESLLVNADDFDTASDGTSDSLTVVGNATNLGDVVIFNVGNVDFQGNLTTTDIGIDGWLTVGNVGTWNVVGDTTAAGAARFQNVTDMTFKGDLTAEWLDVNTNIDTRSDSLTIEGSALIAGLTDIRNVDSARIEGASTFGGGLNITDSNITLNGANTNDVGTALIGLTTVTLGSDSALGAAQVLVSRDADVTILSNEADRTLANNITIDQNGVLTVNTQNLGDLITYTGILDGDGDFVKDGAGTLKVTGAGNIIGGTLTVANGTMQLDNGAEFQAGGAATIQDGGKLSGGGKLTAGQMVLSGRVSAGNTVADVNDFGRMNLAVTGGQVLLDGAVIDLYVGSGNRSNTVEVDGQVGFAAGSGQNAVNIANNWVVGEYTVIETTGGFDGTKDDVKGQFEITFKNAALGRRHEAHLDLKRQDNDLVIVMEAIKNIALEWKGGFGQFPTRWDTNVENWIDPRDGQRVNFADGDYVLFNDNAEQYNVDILAGYDVSGMSINAGVNGNYVFSGKTITGKKTADDFSTGRLDIYNTNGKVTINNTMSFEEGISFVGGGSTNVVLGSNTALGATGNAKEGYVTIEGGKAVTFTSAINGTTNLQNRFASNGGSMTFATGSWGFTNSAQAGLSEIIKSGGDVTINGSASFRNQNAAAQNGWAIDMTDAADLTLNASAGNFTFNGSNSAAVQLNGGNTMTLAGNGDFNFVSGLSGSGSNIFRMNGNGNLTLYGSNSIGTTSGSLAAINGGTLHMTNGSSLSAGTGLFELNGAELVSAGDSTITAMGGINLAGVVDVQKTNGTFGVLSLNGNTTMTDVEYLVAWDANNDSSKIDVTGDVSFGGSNILRLDDSGSWYVGTYELVYASTGAMDAADTWSIFFGDRNVTNDGRYQAELKTVQVGDEAVLQLTTTGLNIGLTWTNSANNGRWDTESTNWKDSANRTDMFMQGDAVLFDGQGNGEVKIVQATRVADMTITGGEYVFTGKSITGSKNGTSIQNAGGNLAILGGNVGFDIAGNFEGGISISGKQTTVKLSKNGQLRADGAFMLEEDATLELTPSEGSIKGSSVTLAGTVVVHRPELDPTKTTEIVKVIEATKTALDTVRLSDIFDASYGLFDQAARFSEDRLIMDIVYSKLTPYEFSVKHGLSNNEKNLAGGLTSIFGGSNIPANMAALQDYLYSLETSEDVAAVIDQMRGSELYADALHLALWSPWRKVFKELDRTDYCDNEYYNRLKENKKLKSREIWFEGYYQHTEVHGTGNAHRYKENRGGMMLGVDMKPSQNSVVGLAFGYGNPRAINQVGKVETDDYTLGLYGRTKVTANSYMHGFLGMGLQNNEARRYETALGQGYNAEYDSYSFYTSLEWVRPVKYSNRINLLPLVALDYQRVWSDSFSEKGGAYAQAVKKANMEEFVARVGLNSTLCTAGRMSLKTRLQYGYMLGGDERSKIDTSFVSSRSGPFMNLHGANIGRNRFNVGLGGEYLLNITRIFWDYDYDCSDHTDAHTAQVGVSTLW